MSFAKPRPSSSSKVLPSSTRQSSEKVPRLGTLTTRGSVLSSTAKPRLQDISSQGTKKIRGLPPSASKPAVDSKVDAERAELEEAYGEYLVSELLRWTAEEHLHDTKIQIQKDCYSLWAAHLIQKEETDALEKEIEELRVLQKFSQTCTEENEKLRQLCQSLPRALERLEKLLVGLVESQAFLEIKGVKLAEGDKIKDAVVENLISNHREKVATIESMLKENAASEDISKNLIKLADALNEIENCFKTYKILVEDLAKYQAREASLKYSSEEITCTDLSLLIPPSVEVPKLIDI